MSLDPDEITKYIRTVVRTVLNLPAGSMRSANQNAPTGDQGDSFGTVLITDFNPVGQDSKTLKDLGVDGQLQQTIEGTRHVVCDVQFFRASAYSSAARLPALLVSDIGISLMNSKGLSLIRCGRVNNLTQVIDTYDEERAQTQIEFYVASVETLTIPTFASVEINLQIDQQSRTSEVNLDVSP